MEVSPLGLPTTHPNLTPNGYFSIIRSAMYPFGVFCFFAGVCGRPMLDILMKDAYIKSTHGLVW